MNVYIVWGHDGQVADWKTPPRLPKICAQDRASEVSEERVPEEWMTLGWIGRRTWNWGKEKFYMIY